MISDLVANLFKRGLKFSSTLNDDGIEFEKKQKEFKYIYEETDKIIKLLEKPESKAIEGSKVYLESLKTLKGSFKDTEELMKELNKE